jgi:hypothetical protein
MGDVSRRKNLEGELNKLTIISTLMHFDPVGGYAVTWGNIRNRMFPAL